MSTSQVIDWFFSESEEENLPKRRRITSSQESCDCHPNRNCDGIRCVEREDERFEKEESMVIRITPFKVGFSREMMKSTDDEETNPITEPILQSEEKKVEEKVIPARCSCQGPGPCAGNRIYSVHSTGGTFKCPAEMMEYIRDL